MRFLIWDFDGTLGFRAGRWSSALISIVEEAHPDENFEVQAMTAQLRRGFPWHSPEIPHPQLTSSDLWWAALTPTFVRAFEAGGLDNETARAMAKRVRETYVNPRYWRLFDDTVPVLSDLSSRGWTHLVLSNHVPELPEILESLGIDELILRVFNSAESGYEKPHPRAFDGVLGTIHDAEAAWVVGDDVEADVRGAGAVGLPAILARTVRMGVRHHCTDLYGVARILESARP